MNRLRIGAVSYLNTKPLVYGLAQAKDECELVFDLPSRLANGLRDGQYDVALVPSIAVFDQPETSIVSDACIGSQGAVWSVKLCSKVPLNQIRTLALDEGSKTSAVLVQILLHNSFGIRPETQTLKMIQDWRHVQTDAVLVIGDRAMSSENVYPYEWDLGAEWTRQTGLPFVFAVWAARPNIHLQSLEQIFNDSRDLGVSNLEKIAEAEAINYGLSIDACRRYLNEHLHFYLGPSQRQGLSLYRCEAAKLGFVSEGSELSFYDCQAT